MSNYKIMKVHESRLKETVGLLEDNLITQKSLQSTLQDLKFERDVAFLESTRRKLQSKCKKISNVLSNLQADRLNLIANRKNHHALFVRYKRKWLEEQ